MLCGFTPPCHFMEILTATRRVGFVENTIRTKLPASTKDIIHHFDVLCNTTVSPAWEFMWQANVEEGREKQFLRQSFTHGANEVPYVTNPSDDVVQVAEAAMKVRLFP
jgi:transcription factor C subunit 3